MEYWVRNMRGYKALHVFVCSSIWICRNELVFNNRSYPLDVSATKIVYYFSEFHKQTKEKPCRIIIGLSIYDFFSKDFLMVLNNGKTL